MKYLIQNIKSHYLRNRGDLNSWHHFWGSKRPDSLGNEAEDLIPTNDLNICNTGTIPTYEKIVNSTRRKSIVDLTLTSDKLKSKICCRRASTCARPSSDHNAIKFKLSLNIQKLTQPAKRSTYKYSTKNLNWQLLHSLLTTEMTTSGYLDVNSEHLI